MDPARQPPAGRPRPRPPGSVFAAALALVAIGLVAIGLGAPRAAPGQALGAGQHAAYAACMSLARDRPQDAFERAQAWAAQGGAEPAEHCAAVALIGLGRTGEAARRLERLAGGTADKTRGLRADLLAQAGQAWLMAGETGKAEAALGAALRLEPANVEVLVDRSIARAALGDYWAAVDDLHRALDLAPGRADILVLRASAYRHLEAPELARDDLRRAFSLDPENPDGLLERGLLARQAGDAAGARAAWLRVIELAEGTPAAEAARAHLEHLETERE